MAMKIRFDSSNIPETPTFILAKNNGDKLGALNAFEINSTCSLSDASEISFKINKYEDNIKSNLWDKVTDFKLVWCKEYDMWYKIKVEIDDTEDGIIKIISCTQLGQAELNQILLHNIEINTEDDIAREEYEIPTVLYNSDHKESSLLHRLLEKAPHYSIEHVDDTIKSIQKTFKFDNKSILNAFKEIEEEIGCIFIYHSNSKEDGSINRAISVYDMQSYCCHCGHRGEFTNTCPECGSSNIREGYGEDTTIFVTSDELGNDIKFTTDTNSVKNCFKLSAGDDLMTATIKSCNVNGSDYIWYISDDLKQDMSDELVNALNTYDNRCKYYQDNYIANIDEDKLDQYNLIINKYKAYKDELKEIFVPIKGYQNLMTSYYDTIDFNLYLTSGLVPTFEMTQTTAEKEVLKLTTKNLSPVSVQNIDALSLASANNAVTAMAKVLVNSIYKVEIKTSSLTNYTWTGKFVLTNYSDEDDKAETDNVIVMINSNYEGFIRQKIEKLLNKHEDTDYSIVGLFKKTYSDFCEEIKKYCLNKLKSFHDACQSCIDILIEQGVADSKTWSGSNPNLYDDLYMPYRNKLSAIEYEMKIREGEIRVVNNIEDSILKIKNDIQKELNFQNFLGEELWLELCTFRREDKYSNTNYISDGLDNTELFSKANEFIKTAKDEIYKSAERQHSISCNLKNLLLINKFKKITDYFEVGNWIRIRVDEDVYKLRLINYEINYDSLDQITVGFSDVIKTVDGLSDQRSIIEKASSMASSYSYVQRQASKGEESKETINDWFENGLNATNTRIVGGADNQTQTWDNHGMLFRKYDSITETYDDTQLKIINSTIAITDDNWKTTKTAIGKYYYRDYKTNELKSAYGINAEVLVGKLILGENLNINNKNGTLNFDNEGLNVTNGKNSVSINPNSEKLFVLSNNNSSDNSEIFYLDNDGNGYFKGNVISNSGTFGNFNLRENGFNGLIKNKDSSEITTDAQYALYNGEKYKNKFSIVIKKDSEENDINNIKLEINVIDITIGYSYITNEIINDTSTDGETTDNSSNQITNQITNNDIIKIRLQSETSDVTNKVVVSWNSNTGVKTYTYTHTLTNDENAETYLINLVKQNEPSLQDMSLTITSAVVFAQYVRKFTSYNIYSHIGADYFNYNDLLKIKDSEVTISNVNLIGNCNICNNVYMENNTFIKGTMAINDYWRILGGGSYDDGYLEIATSDSGNEPIYVRQYTGEYETINNTLILLDKNGDTVIPNTIITHSIKGHAGFGIDIESRTIFRDSDVFMGWADQEFERRLNFQFAIQGKGNLHHCYLYGGNPKSTTGIGMWDRKSNVPILVYNDKDKIISIGAVNSVVKFYDLTNTQRAIVASVTDNGKKVAYLGCRNSNTLVIGGEWGKVNSYETRTVSVSSSDIRLKENVSYCDVNALSLIDKIKLHSFDWKNVDNNKHQRIGFIADELELLDNRLTNGGGYNEDGTMNTKCINDFYLMGYVVKAIQELKKEIDELKKEV